MASSGDLTISSAKEILYREYARIQAAAPATKQQVLMQVYSELFAQGKQDVAELLMLFHSLVGAIEPPMSDRPNVTYNITGSNIGSATFSSQVGSINTSMNIVAQQPGGTDFANALKSLTEAVAKTEELNDAQKRDALDALELIGKQAEEPAEKRKPGILKPVLESVPKILSSASALLNLWHSLGPHLTGFFGL